MTAQIPGVSPPPATNFVFNPVATPTIAFSFDEAGVPLYTLRATDSPTCEADEAVCRAILLLHGRSPEAVEEVFASLGYVFKRGAPLPAFAGPSERELAVYGLLMVCVFAVFAFGVRWATAHLRNRRREVPIALDLRGSPKETQRSFKNSDFE